MSKDRVEALSDGVFAIVMTLLVLELRVPHVPAHSTLSQYGIAMAPLLPKLVSFVLSFVMLAIHWVSHQHFFRHLRSAPPAILWLNNLLLLWMCLLPFPTAMLGENPTDQFPILIYALNSLLAALTFYALRNYAARARLFNVAHAAAEVHGPARSIPAIVLFGLAIPFSFISAYLAIACLLIVPLVYFVPTATQGRGK